MSGTDDAGVRRRTLLAGAALFAAGNGTGALAFGDVQGELESRRPVEALAARGTAANADGRPGRGQVTVNWAVDTDRKLVALTFDDGPSPHWTPMVLKTLDRYTVPATFFMVGQRLRANAAVVRGRLDDRHEVGNHTWAHRDLAQRGLAQAYEDLARTHEAIVDVTGREPSLMRPPYGHLGGSTALAAARLHYDVVLWSMRMVEQDYPHDPAGHARYIVANTAPGTILLAHDTGAKDRLVALRGLPAIITGLRRRGFEFVTVSDLIARAGSDPPPEDDPGIHAAAR